MASTEVAAYRGDDKTRYAEAENGWLPFISIADAQNVAIVGEGTIDGQGAVWWERWRENIRATGKKGGTDRPRLIYITRASNVLIDGVTLTHSPSFHVVTRYAHDVDINGTRILSPWHAPNTDAIDPIDSQNIRITNNYIDCNDDHIAIKAEKADPRFPDGVVDNIYIANNTLKQGRGISIGSESAGGVNNVLVENNTFEGSMYGIRIKSPRGKGGEVKISSTVIPECITLRCRWCSPPITKPRRLCRPRSISCCRQAALPSASRSIRRTATRNSRSINTRLRTSVTSPLRI